MKPQNDQVDPIAALLRLKRYEQPDAGFDARNMAAIRTRIAAQPERRTWGRVVQGWFEQTPSPVLRYCMVTALVALVGLNVLTYTLTPGAGPSAVITNETPVLTRTEPAISAPTAVAEVAAPTNVPNEMSAKPVFVFEYPASNRHSGGGMQYGTGPVVPVRFDY